MPRSSPPSPTTRSSSSRDGSSPRARLWRSWAPCAMRVISDQRGSQFSVLGSQFSVLSPPAQFVTSHSQWDREVRTRSLAQPVDLRSDCRKYLCQAQHDLAEILDGLLRCIAPCDEVDGQLPSGLT